jgi:hypothetical protein
MSVVTELLSIVGAWIEGVFGWFAGAFEGVLEIFYDTTYTGVRDASSSKFTVLGILLLLGIAMGIVFFALRYIRSLISR